MAEESGRAAFVLAMANAGKAKTGVQRARIKPLNESLYLLERAMGIEPTALCLGRTLVGLIVKATDSKLGV